MSFSAVRPLSCLNPAHVWEVVRWVLWISAPILGFRQKRTRNFTFSPCRRTPPTRVTVHRRPFPATFDSRYSPFSRMSRSRASDVAARDDPNIGVDPSLPRMVKSPPPFRVNRRGHTNTRKRLWTVLCPLPFGVVDRLVVVLSVFFSCPSPVMPKSGTCLGSRTVGALDFGSDSGISAKAYAQFYIFSL